MDYLVDSSFVIALLNVDDVGHQKARAVFASAGADLLLPSITLAEIAYHLHRMGSDAAVKGLRRVVEGPLQVVDPIQADYRRTLEILEKYHDTRIDFVDACIMALAERLNIETILTFDRRDFGLYQPSHCEKFRILP